MFDTLYKYVSRSPAGGSRQEAALETVRVLCCRGEDPGVERGSRVTRPPEPPLLRRHALLSCPEIVSVAGTKQIL